MKNDPYDERTLMIKRSFSLDTIGVFITSILTTLISLPISILIARFLGPEGKGTLTIVLLIVGQIGILLTLGVEVSLIHFGGRKPRDLGVLASASMGLGILLGLVGMGSAVAIFALVSYEIIPVHLLPFLILITSTIPMMQTTLFLRSLMRTSGRIIEEGLLGLIGAFFNLAVIGVVFMAGFGLKGVLMGLWLSTGLLTLLIFVLGVHWNLVTSWPIFSISNWKPLVTYGLKLHVGSVFQTLNYRFDMYLVAYFLGSASVGFYSVAVAMGEWLWLIPVVLGAPLMQRVVTGSEEDVNRMVGVINRLTSAILVLGTLVLSLVGNGLIHLLYGEAFSASYLPLLLLLPGIWALGLWKNFINDLSVRGYPTTKSYTSGIAMLLTVVLDIILIPRWGTVGAAIASSIAYLTAWVVTLRLYCRITGYHPWDLLVIRQEDLSLAFHLLKNSLRHLQASSVQGGNVGS
jgi:O-antigen/teichoic acid export membrane protein